VADHNGDLAAEQALEIGRLKQEHDKEMKVMESKHKKAMTATGKQYNTVINQKNR
jgi:hypothetical protein